MNSIAKKAIVTVALTASLAGVGAGVGAGVAEAKPYTEERCALYFDAFLSAVNSAHLANQQANFPLMQQYQRTANIMLGRLNEGNCF